MACWLALITLGGEGGIVSLAGRGAYKGQEQHLVTVLVLL